MRTAIFLSLALGACAMDGEPLGMVDLGAMEFHVTGPNMGVYPDDSVLVDPHNPFADIDVTETGKWELQSRASGIPAFYAWATLLARSPGGEAQYYAALNLALIYERKLAPPEQTEVARQLAIRGYQAVLDHFPDSVTYDASGTVAYDLATLAYKGIVALGGEPEGWILVPTADGGERAVPVP